MAKHKKTKRYRNARAGGMFKVPKGALGNGVATVLGGGGGALLGGILANQEIAKPSTTGFMMVASGLLAGALTEGHTRTAMNGLAAAGSGQLTLEYMRARAERKIDGPPKASAPPPVATNHAPALPAPHQSAQPVSMPSNARSGAHVWSAFRDAAGELEIIDDDGRYDAGHVLDVDGWEVDTTA